MNKNVAGDNDDDDNDDEDVVDVTLRVEKNTLINNNEQHDTLNVTSAAHTHTAHRTKWKTVERANVSFQKNLAWWQRMEAE